MPPVPSLDRVAVATGLALALALPLGAAPSARASSTPAPVGGEGSTLRAFRDAPPTGTPVTGTPTVVGAPAVTPGRYLDELLTDGTNHYRLDVPVGTRPYVAATIVPPRGDYDRSSLEGITVSLEADRSTCITEYSPFQDQGRGLVPATAVATLPEAVTGSADPGCGVAGSYDVTVTRQMSGTDVARVPLELAVLLEPPVLDLAGLPDPAVPPPADPPVAVVTGPGAPVVGGGSADMAPALTPGTYVDALRPGETSWYRVPVGWGQRLAVTAVVAPVVRGETRSSTFVAARLGLANPARQPMAAQGSSDTGDVRETLYAEGEDDAELRGFTAPVTYRNRDATGTPEVETTSLAGDQLVSLAIEDYGNGADETPTGLLPVTLVVEVLGPEQGAPTYDAPAGPGVGQAIRDPSDGGTARSSLAYAGAGAAAALLAGGLLLAPRAGRRRRPPPNAAVH